MRFAAMARHRGIWPLSWMCQTLSVTPGGYYAWLKRPESERAAIDRKLTAAIRTSFADSDRTYKWAADFPYLWTAEGWLYVAVVLDLFSRRVVGWSMSTQMPAQFVADAMLMAIWRRGPKRALLHHSDQGSQPGFNRSSQQIGRAHV